MFFHCKTLLVNNSTMNKCFSGFWFCSFLNLLVCCDNDGTLYFYCGLNLTILSCCVMWGKAFKSVTLVCFSLRGTNYGKESTIVLVTEWDAAIILKKKKYCSPLFPVPISIPLSDENNSRGLVSGDTRYRLNSLQCQRSTNKHLGDNCGSALSAALTIPP